MTRDADALRDEAALLRRSVEDARDEHARGDLDDDALASIEQRDGRRLDEVLDELGALGAQGSDGARPRTDAAPAPSDDAARRPRRRLVALAALCTAVAVGVVAVVLARPSASAPVHLTRAAKVQVLLVAAELEVARGHTDAALTAYDAVLRLDARDSEALAETGWLRYEIGLRDRDPAGAAAGEAALRRAVRIAPREAAGHLYLGIALLQHDRDRAGALAQLWAAAALPESTIEQSLTAQFIALARRGR